MTAVLLSKGTRRAAMIAAIALLAPSVVHSQTLNDPTRPPPSVLAAQKGSIGVPPAGGTGAEADSAPRVQMLSIGPSRKYAVISGRVVRVGGMIDGAKLVEVRPNAVVLQSAEGARETINLYPGVEIRSVKPRDSAHATEPPVKAKGREGTSGSASKKEK